MRKIIVMTVALVMPFMAAAPTSAGEDLELVRYMATMQYFGHKTALAIDARNRPLARLYAHELEEVMEKLGEVESYDGHPVGRLSGSILKPAYGLLEEALEGNDWDAASTAFDEVVKACNGCHQSTDHEYIRIERRADNPYMQSFAPAE